MSKIVERDKYFVRVIKDEDPEKEDKIVPFVDFVYGRRMYKGTMQPLLTVCIVPTKNEDGELCYGIGLARCSRLDNPSKSKGRRIAEARARAVMDMHCDTIRFKKHANAEDEEEGRVCGLFTHWSNAPASIDAMQFTAAVFDKMTRSFGYITRDIIPEIVGVQDSD